MKLFREVKKYGPRVAFVAPAAMLPMLSQAAIDVSAVTTGITEAQTAILAVIGGLLALSVAIFGLVKVYSFVKRKAGA